MMYNIYVLFQTKNIKILINYFLKEDWMHEEARAIEGFFVFRPIWPTEAIKTALLTTQIIVKKIGQWTIVAINILATAFVFLGLPIMATMLGLEFGGDFLAKQSRIASQKAFQEMTVQKNKELESFNSSIDSKIESIKFLAKMDKAWEVSSPEQRSTWAVYHHVLPEVQSWLGRNNKSIDPDWYKRLKK